MPRQSRLDVPGMLHHVIIRGIERKKLFRSQADYDDFVQRLSVLLPETQTACYAWALLSNHAHFLFRSGPAGIATLMRRLLTGYAVGFNRRHRRHGQLFQNRYKSIICQEDGYLKELVRYIHLNPLRARMVADSDGLKRYAYCGHGILLNPEKGHWQDVDYVLKHFSKNKSQARKGYQVYVEAGISQGRRAELTGGGLIRSLGGWAQVKKLRKKGLERIKGDQRILGDTDFVQSVLKEGNEKFERSYALARAGITQDHIAEKAAGLFHIDPREIFIKSRRSPLAQARAVFCFWAVRELGLPLSHLARQMSMTPAGVGAAVKRGESVIKQSGFRLLESPSLIST